MRFRVRRKEVPRRKPLHVASDDDRFLIVRALSPCARPYFAFADGGSKPIGYFETSKAAMDYCRKIARDEQ